LAQIQPGGILLVLDRALAHVASDKRTHLLRDHLIETARLAARFARIFQSNEWAEIAGLWHDLGKMQPDFQRKLQSVLQEDGKAGLTLSMKVDHSTPGAAYAVRQLNMYGRILAYIIAGHHGGLPDWSGDEMGKAALKARLSRVKDLGIWEEREVKDFLFRPLPSQMPTGKDPAFWIRMVFSCLVDADFLDTERFFDPELSWRRTRFPSLSHLIPLFSSYIREKCEQAPDTPVNRLRRWVLACCREKALDDPGFFSLTVPTGGGKTLSSMAFALEHALKHGHQRIIYVIPYTSIIEQTAQQFRQIFGDVVVEHHSNFEGPDDDESEKSLWRLACENWDAPIVVTTNVQFLESLYAAKPGRCRKLHNIAGSVVILDEAQLLPVSFLRPCLEVLKELVKNYGVSLVLCTATQPALTTHKAEGYSFDGLSNVREIIPDPEGLFREMERVDIWLPEHPASPVEWADLAGELMEHPSVLCIVNRRDDCRELWSLLPQNTYHLSALMCGAHRSRRIAEIKDRLRHGIPTRVVSTQLVEAGVDIDFPFVYRALAGLDSIAQAAGRCNREGLLVRGKLVVFVPPSRPPQGILRQAADVAQMMMSQGKISLSSPETFEEYFRRLYWIQGDERLDSKGIGKLLGKDDELRFSFRTAAERFRIIDQDLLPVVVPYGEEGTRCVEELKAQQPNRRLLRKAQRFVVHIAPSTARELTREGVIREVHPGVYVLEHGSFYREDVGFDPHGSAVYDPDELII
jgi:CRISPR-associated endonuclease/helicase Cas3